MRFALSDAICAWIGWFVISPFLVSDHHPPQAWAAVGGVWVIAYGLFIGWVKYGDHS